MVKTMKQNQKFCYRDDSIASLFLFEKAILLPILWISINIMPYHFVIVFVTYNMVMK